MSQVTRQQELVVLFKKEAQVTIDDNFRINSSKLQAPALRQLRRKLRVDPKRTRRLFDKATLAQLPNTARAAFDRLSFDVRSVLLVEQETPKDLEALQAKLLTDDNVAAAYIKPVAEDARVEDWATTDLETSQGYLEAAPNGIDAKYAWRFTGGRGENVSVCDVEQGFNFDHEDFPKNFAGFLGGNNVDSSKNHGTAVLGVIAANDDGTGVTGISHNATIYAISHNGQGTSSAIINAANTLRAGDIILLEVHRAGPASNPDRPAGSQDGYIAIEWWPDDLIAVQYAVSKGIIVVEAAGNGAEDLDAEIYDRPQTGFPVTWRNPFNLGNPQSGAVIVGAGSPWSSTDRTILSFSNWGSRVDAQGWGQGVATIGYGGLQSDQTVVIDPNNSWTADSNGPQTISSILSGMSLANVDAALWSGTNNKIYIFQGDRYSRIDAATMQEEADYPKKIADGWTALPSSFRSNIDAALWNDKSDKIYFFKGDEYVRIDPNNNWQLDGSYPKKIVGNWPGLPANFTVKVDTAFWSHTNQRVYMFSDSQYVRIDPFNNWTVEPGYPKPIDGNWKDFPKSFDDSVDHAFMHPTQGKIYISKGEDIVYTSGFSGTSSASPVVLGAIACTQSRLKARGKTPLTSTAAQALLRATGTTQLRFSGEEETDAKSNWRGVNASFGRGLDAAMFNGNSDKIYFFRGSQYVRIDPAQDWNVEKGYPKNISDEWDNLDSGFQSNLDAALWSGHNTKAYFFKGSEYVRLDPANGFRMEAGYPKPIAGNWPGLPTDFQSDLDAAVWNSKNNRVYFFKGDNYVRIDPTNGWNMEPGYPKPIANNWPALTGNGFDVSIGAAVWSGTNNKVYAFKGEDYVRIDPFAGWTAPAGYPKVIARQRIGKRPDLKEIFAHLDIDANWPGLPASFGTDMDAGFYSRKNDRVYLFKGSQYVRIDPAVRWEVEAGYPKAIAGNWVGLPAGFHDDIDATLYNAKNDKVYVFKGDAYMRLDPFNGWQADAGYPKPIAGNWPGFPAHFAQGVDACFYSDKNKRIYFFKGDEYIRVDPFNGHNVDPGYPKAIDANWNGLQDAFDADLDLTVYVPGKRILYAFKGSEYTRIDGNSWNPEPYYPRPIIR